MVELGCIEIYDKPLLSYLNEVMSGNGKVRFLSPLAMPSSR